jgi:small subunit ribosomal protein S13
MIIISGYVLKENERIYIGLRKIFGIGKTRALQIIMTLNLSKNIRISAIKGYKLGQLSRLVSHYIHGLHLKRNLKNNLKKLLENRCYRGVRHSYFLSVRGQRTRTNAKTQKNKKTKKKKF